MGKAVAWAGCGLNASSVSDITPSVRNAVGIDEFPIPPSHRHSDTVVMAGYRGEIADTHHSIFSVPRFSKIGDDRVVGIAEIDPLKSTPVIIDFKQRGLFTIDAV